MRRQSFAIFSFKIKPIFWLSLLLVTLNPFKVLALTPDDNRFNEQWYLKRIAAPAAWDLISESPEVTVAVIDTGVMINHPDLIDNLWHNPKEIPGNNLDDDKNGYKDDIYGWDFVNNTAEPTPKFKPGYTIEGIEHGTVVAGILGARGQNLTGISGISFNVKIMALKALDDAGQANGKQVASAIDYAVKNGAKIINLSFTGLHKSSELEQAIRRAYNAGLIIVAAGGNEAKGQGRFLDKEPLYPVCYDGVNNENLVVGVAATGPLDEKAAFSGYGKAIDITAPGVSMFSTAYYNLDKDAKFNLFYDGYWSGTSFAVPLVSGALALMMQANPSLKPQELVKMLKDSADNISSINGKMAANLGAGRLNLERALKTAISARDREKVNILLYNDATDKGSVKIVNARGVVKARLNLWPGQDFNLAAGDFNGDGQVEIAAGQNNGPEVRIYKENGQLLKKFLAFEAGFKGGVSLVAGDVNGDGRVDLVVASGAGRKPEVKIYNKDFKVVKSFLAYAPTFGGGVNLALGELNGDNQAEIVVAPASRGSAHIRIFKADGKLFKQFFAYEDYYRGGFNVTVLSAYSSLAPLRQIAVASTGALPPYVHILNLNGELIRRFAPYDPRLLLGVNLSSADIDNDGQPELIVGAGAGHAPHLQLLKANGALIKGYYSDKKDQTRGVRVTAFYR